MADTLAAAAEQITGASKNLTITDIQTKTFTYQSRVGRDDEGHGHPAPAHTKTQILTRVRTSIGLDGYYFGGSAETAATARRMIVGMDPLMREPIWHKLQQVQRLDPRAMLDRYLAAIDCALWDFAGRLTGLPAHKLLGGSREKVPAYASTMCGDDIPGGLGSPEDYANFARQCVAQGYKGFKLHTWMSPYGPDLKRDIAACRAVREAVGPDIKLMLDPHHHYSREEALYLGRGIEEVDFYWMEEPMDEHSISSYIWLTENLQRLQICGPETAEGQFYTRAEWIVRGAADLSRVGISDVGGISPAMKGPPLRVVPHALRGPRRRRGQPAGTRRDGYPRRDVREGAAPPARRFRRREALAEERDRPGGQRRQRADPARPRPRRGHRLGLHQGQHGERLGLSALRWTDEGKDGLTAESAEDAERDAKQGA